MNMNPIEGQIDIDLYPDNSHVARADIHSTRPLQASQVMVGKSPEEALSLIPLMYNVCGIAQARTALRAIQDQLAISPNPAAEIARDMLVLVENAREHLFRVLVDWPRLFELDQDQQPLPLLGRLIPECKQALFVDSNAFALDSELQVNRTSVINLIDELDNTLEQAVFQRSTDDWLKIYDINALIQWVRESDSPAAKVLAIIDNRGWGSQGVADLNALPQLDRQELINRFDASDADEFIAHPQWHGQHYETSCLTRQLRQPLIRSLTGEFHIGLLTRMTARLVELARIPRQLRDLLARLGSIATEPASDPISAPGLGLAQTEAARGRLIHRVQLENGKIIRYQILAPTEWNFHPQGLITQSLENLSASDEQQLQQLAKLMINAIDPCVGYELSVH